MQNTIKLGYQKELESVEKKLVRIRSTLDRIGVIRLLSFILLVIMLYSLWDNSLLWLITLIWIVLFGIVIKYDERTGKEKRALEALRKLLNEELKSDINYSSLYDNGKDYVIKDHAYSNDLDVLGENSLFHYINRCNSKPGSRILADWLLFMSDPKTIEDRQKAVNELTHKQEFRKSLGVIGILSRSDTPMADDLNWLGNKETVRVLQSVARISPMFSAVNIFLLISSFYYSPLLIPFISFFFFSYYYIYSLKWGKIKHIYKQISKSDSYLTYIQHFIKTVEKEKFSSSVLQKLIADLKVANKSGRQTINSLKSAIKWADYRLNFLYQLSINSLFYTDIWLLLYIEKWKLNHGAQFNKWQKIIGHIEALQSMAILRFNNPDWSFPVFVEQFEISLTNAGHPLIAPDERVLNSYKTMEHGTVDLLTGSNMSGKSTFLRTLGVNIVLALAGAPVCAESMRLSPLKLITYMRIQDNLNDRTSTFYAEIKRLKFIMEESRKQKHVFLLLDELLRGTNSNDKKAGSIAIIRDILKQKSNAVIATHDLSIAEYNEGNNVEIRNFHFDITVKENRMYFDYKLRNGICRSTNASLLLKEIGIDVG